MRDVATFPDDSRADERIERISHEADTDDTLVGYVVLAHGKDDWISFKFAVPTCPGALDRMVGALDRVRHRLIQYGEGER